MRERRESRVVCKVSTCVARVVVCVRCGGKGEGWREGWREERAVRRGGR